MSRTASSLSLLIVYVGGPAAEGCIKVATMRCGEAAQEGGGGLCPVIHSWRLLLLVSFAAQSHDPSSQPWKGGAKV